MCFVFNSKKIKLVVSLGYRKVFIKTILMHRCGYSQLMPSPAILCAVCVGSLRVSTFTLIIYSIRGEPKKEEEAPLLLASCHLLLGTCHLLHAVTLPPFHTICLGQKYALHLNGIFFLTFSQRFFQHILTVNLSGCVCVCCVCAVYVCVRSLSCHLRWHVIQSQSFLQLQRQHSR